jgi:putative transposase
VSRFDGQEVFEIARPAQRQSSTEALQGILGAAEEQVNAIRVAALERALELEVEELVSSSEARDGGRVLQDVPYRGTVLKVRVPRLRMADGSVCFPPMFDALLETAPGVLELLEAGVSTRDAASIMTLLYGQSGSRGTSSSSLSRKLVEAGEEQYQLMMERRFDADPIVAVSLDGTGIGTPGKKRTVMIAIGITARGERLVLGAAIVQSESGAEVHSFLEDIVKRGVDPRALFTVDQGAGIAAALDRLGVTHRQLCTTHVARVVAKKLPEELQLPFRLKLYDAWAEESAEAALAKLEAVAAEIDSLGFAESAKSVRDAMEGTVTVQRLGLSRQLRKQLRSTNPIESVNGSIKAGLRLVKLWRDDGPARSTSGRSSRPVSMRLRWVAKRLLDLEAKSWTRFADPAGLVALMERILPGRHDPEAIRSRLPPNLRVDRVAVALDDPGQLTDFVARHSQAGPEATWEGSPAALAALEVEPGAKVEVAELERAMRGLEAKSDQVVRTPGRVTVRRTDDAGNPCEVKVAGLLHVSWELSAPPALAKAWSAAGPEQRAEIERSLREAAIAAVEVVTKTTQPTHGFASTVDLRAVEGADGLPDLRVSGVAVAVQRGKSAKLNSPAADEAFRSATARRAEDAAKAILDRSLERALAQTRAEPAYEPETPTAALLAGADERALELAAGMVALEPGKIGEIAAREESARAGLELVGPEARHWWEANRAAAAWEVAASRLQNGASGRSPWYPVARGARLVLGEERSQLLLGDAAHLLGRAEVDADLREALRKPLPASPLAGLERPAARVDRAAAATAARYDGVRREALESARARASAGRVAAIEVPIGDRRGRPVVRPAKRFAKALGHRATWFGRYSNAIAPELEGEHEDVLKNLVETLEEPWGSLDSRAGFKDGRLEVRRDSLLGEWLERRYASGRSEERTHRAEADGDASRIFAAAGESEVNERLADRDWRELRQIEAQIDRSREERGGPEPERFVRQHPEAALYDAVIVVAQQRALGERQLQQVVDPPSRDLAGAGLDPGG